jgi:hypothetical protein
VTSATQRKRAVTRAAAAMASAGYVRMAGSDRIKRLIIQI